ncbi:hypothetical protein CDL12_21373 [Handroanthus impetiginosus]|uniref:Uncharacterized protein n=1 Tax=Handroanthus impetiginosus TaxID=429701 RepID=A0A2G9GLJ4_9LAMI|nr:hypothetical protein CDL12_21373 [Handroanthus impetiginosus]
MTNEFFCFFFIISSRKQSPLHFTHTHQILRKMANDDTEKRNGVLVVEGVKDREEGTKELTLYTIFNRLIAAVFFPDRDSSASLLQRIKSSLSVNIPLLGEASRNSGRRVLIWTRRGGALRALLVVSVGTIFLLTLTGLLVFMLFFLAATVKAVVISLLVSLAAAGGFLALFFACVAAIYIVALSIAAFVISTATISAVIAVLIVTGWIGFFCTLWLAAKKSIGLARRSLSVTGSAVSSYTGSWHGRDHKVYKKSD